MTLCEDRIRSMIAPLEGVIGVYASCPATGEKWGHQQELPLEAASVIKLPIMVEAFRQREAGRLDFAALVEIRPEDRLPSCGALTYLHEGVRVTVEDLVTLMVILSDNTATNLLISMLGQENVNACIDSLGLRGTRLNRMLFRPELSRMGIQNYVTAADMGALLEGILRGEVVSPAASAQMLDILRKQRLNGKMPFWLHDQDVGCAHKTGEDDGITHDVGIIMTQPPVVFCFLSNETNVPRAERVLQDAAALLAGIDVH